MRNPRRRASAVALAALGITFALPLTAASADATALTCASAYQAEADRASCLAASATIDAVLRTVYPTGRAQLMADLAAGQDVGGTTLRCEVNVTCDLAPVARAAFTALHGTDLTGLSANSAVGDSVNLALGASFTEVAVPATQVVQTALAQVVGADAGTRVAEMQAAINRELAALTGQADVESVSRAVVGLVVTAFLAPPHTPDVLGPKTHAVGTFADEGAQVTVAPEGDPLTVHTGSRSAEPGGVSLIAPGGCSGSWEYAHWLKVDKQPWENHINIRSGYGIYKMTWTDPAMARRCPKASIRIDATLQAEATSNGGACCGASKTDTGPMVPGHGTLTPEDPGYVYGPSHDWEHAALDVDFDLPWGAEFHAFSNGAGNFKMSGLGRLWMSKGYVFGLTRRQDKGIGAECIKHGESEEFCHHWDFD